GRRDGHAGRAGRAARRAARATRWELAAPRGQRPGLDRSPAPSRRNGLARDRGPARPRRSGDCVALRGAAPRPRVRWAGAPVSGAGSRVLTLGEIEQARRVILPYLRPSPLRRSFALRRQDGWLKLECWQPTGSFKVRGAVNHMCAIPEEGGARGVVAAA